MPGRIVISAADLVAAQVVTFAPIMTLLAEQLIAARGIRDRL